MGGNRYRRRLGPSAVSRAVFRAPRSLSPRHWTRQSVLCPNPPHRVGRLLARDQQFGNALTKECESTLREVVRERVNRVVDVREEVLGVQALKVIVPNRDVVGLASPGVRGRTGTLT